jgi:hypothetical protein
MGVTTTQTNKPFNPRGNDQSPKGYNRASLFSGKALDFDGVNDYVDGGTLDITGYTQMSISFYMNVDTTTQDFRLISIRHIGVDDIRIFHSVSVGAGVLNFSLDDGDVDNIGVNFETNQWYHVVMTHDGTTLKAYFNGVEQASTASTFDYANANGLFYIGRYTGGAVTFYDGEAANVKIFNTALTAAQVADLYNNPEKVVPTGLESNLKLWLPMMEGAGTTAINGAPDALGSEEVTNGDFATDSDWTKGTGWSISGGLASSDGSQSATSGLTSATISGLNNKGSLLLEVVVDSVTAGTLYATLQGTGGLDIVNISSAGTYKVLCETGDSNAQITLGASADFVGSVSSVSLKELKNCGAISGATWTHGIGTPVAQTAVIDWNKGDYLNAGGTITEILVPQGLTSGRDLLGNLFENVRKQGALNLDGKSWAEVHDNESLDFGTGSFTLEAWVKAKYEFSGSTLNVILNLGGNASNAGAVCMLVGQTNKITAVYNNLYLDSNTILTEGEWYHVVVNFNGTHSEIYINGAFEKSATRTAADISNALVKEIGKDSNVSRTYKDQIAQPRIYNRALTAEEVQRNYNAGKNTYTN